ncbi:MAG: hypothetical protein PHH16_05175 [Candidatus Gracilibacteria bacterium]|nr:hypothetical protein [Candidatus Gracilibacteria bacterium]
MSANKSIQVFLVGLLLISGVLSSLTFSSVQANATSSVTLSPTITAKLDAFVAKVQTLRSKYPADADWNIFLDTLNSKVGALKSQYNGNTLILTVLDRLSSGVGELKVQTTTVATAGSSTPIIVPNTELAGTYANVSELVQKAKSIGYANCITVDGGNVYGTMGPCLSIQAKKPVILTQSNPGTFVGNYYHYPINTHQETPFPELDKGPKSFAPMMHCEIKDLSTLDLLKNDSPSASTSIFKMWDDNIITGAPAVAQYSGHNLRWVIPEHGCIAVKFTTGGKPAIFSFGSEMSTNAPLAPNILNISRNPGDFDYANIDSTGSVCGATTMGINGVYATIGDTNNTGRYAAYDNCHLQTNTTYYINIRNEAAWVDSRHNARGIDSCPTGTIGGCGGVFGLHYTE